VQARPAPATLAKRAIWAVQLASFASSVNANALRDKLLEDGFEASDRYWVGRTPSECATWCRVVMRFLQLLCTWSLDGCDRHMAANGMRCPCSLAQIFLAQKLANQV